MDPLARQAFEQARHDIEQARLAGARALNLSPRRFVCDDGAVHPGNAVYRGLARLPEAIGTLSELERLDVSGTRLGDLSPLTDLPRLACLHFHHTPAATGDAALARIAAVEDDAERTRTALSRIAALDRHDEPALPAAVPAPVEGEFDGGRLAAAPPPQPQLPGEAGTRAECAWEALRGYHAEMSGVLCGRNMPNLDRAMAAFGAALGQDYAGLNVLALGTHGRRIARIAARADEMLLEDAAADLQEFAAAITLYLGRFAEWRAYVADAEASPERAGRAEAARPAARELIHALSLEAWVEAGLPARMAAAEEAMDDGPGDPVAAQGLAASLRNVLSAIGRHAVESLRRLRRGTGRLARDFMREMPKAVARRAAGVATAAVLGFLAAQAHRLAALAETLPAELGWLRDLLAYLGLA